MKKQKSKELDLKLVIAPLKKKLDKKIVVLNYDRCRKMMIRKRKSKDKP